MKAKPREHPPCCSRCRHRGFSVAPYSCENPFKPIFTCGSCGNSWAMGRDGEPDINFVTNPEIVEETKRLYAEANRNLFGY